MNEQVSSKRLPWGNGRIAFLAQQQQIQSLLAQGYPQLQIYRTLQQHLNGLSYPQFSHHVRKSILNKQRSSNKSQPGPEDILDNQPAQQPQSLRSFNPGPKTPDINQLF